MATGNQLHQAIELFRRLLREFNKGETRYYDQALQQIKTLQTRPLDRCFEYLSAESELQFALNARNLIRSVLCFTKLICPGCPVYQIGGR